MELSRSGATRAQLKLSQASYSAQQIARSPQNALVSLVWVSLRATNLAQRVSKDRNGSSAATVFKDTDPNIQQLLQLRQSQLALQSEVGRVVGSS